MTAILTNSKQERMQPCHIARRLEMDFKKAYKTIIARIVERGGQRPCPFVWSQQSYHGYPGEICFLPNYAIERVLEFFPELKKEEIYCYLNRKDKPYHWI